jgi:Transposase DDE domain group 1
LVKPTARFGTVEVTADGEGLVSHAGVALLVELADRVGLSEALSEAMADTRERRSAHDPGRVLRDVAVMLADGGDCVTDLDAYRGQERLFGAKASETTTHRVLKSIDEQLLGRVRAARAAARARAWDAGGRPDTLTLDIDATILISHSEKELAAGTWKRTFGYHPLECYLDETGEPLAALLRAGNAGSNTAQDHVRVLELALAQLPQPDLDRPMLVRTDTGGCSHEFIAACRETDIRYSVGYELDDRVRQAALKVKESGWIDAIEPDGGPRDGAWVAEVTEHLDLSAWGHGARLIVRRERPHPGAQFQIFDEHGYRYTCFITDQTDTDIAVLELRHRGRARVEDRIRTGKDTGMRNLPHHAFAHNQTWLEISLIAQELLCWMRLLCLDGRLTLAEPKRLRQRLLHTAAKLVRHGRRTHLKLDRDWPWSHALAAAFTTLRTIPELR